MCGLCETVNAARCENNVGTGLGEPGRKGDAKTRRGAGDDDNLVVHGEQFGDGHGRYLSRKVAVLGLTLRRTERPLGR